MEYRNCNLCQEPQEITPEALNAWEDMFGVKSLEQAEPCLCTGCYWRIKDANDL